MVRVRALTVEKADSMGLVVLNYGTRDTAYENREVISERLHRVNHRLMSTV